MPPRSSRTRRRRVRSGTTWPSWEPPSEPLLAATVAYELALRNVAAPELVARFGGAGLDLSTTGAYGYGIWALLLLERFSEAKAELDRAVEAGRRTGALVTYALALVLRAGLHLRSGALQAAEADALQSLELSKHPSWRFGNAASMQFLAEILLEQGRLEEAAEAAAAIDPVPQVAVDVLAQQARARSCWRSGGRRRRSRPPWPSASGPRRR